MAIGTPGGPDIFSLYFTATPVSALEIDKLGIRVLAMGLIVDEDLLLMFTLAGEDSISRPPPKAVPEEAAMKKVSDIEAPWIEERSR